MNNYLCIGGEKIALNDDQIARIREQFVPKARLGEAAVGKTVEIGKHEYIVLKHDDGKTHLLMRDFLDVMKFGKSNDYKESYVKEKLDAFATELAEAVGEDNIYTHVVDLTADDGLKCYGSIMARVSLLTCSLYREYVEIIDKFSVSDWWWLATAFSTPKHGYSETVKCVSPSGVVYDYNFSNVNCGGVRPFCILNSNIFVS